MSAIKLDYMQVSFSKLRKSKQTDNCFVKLIMNHDLNICGTVRKTTTSLCNPRCLLATCPPQAGSPANRGTKVKSRNSIVKKEKDPSDDGEGKEGDKAECQTLR